MKKILSVLFVFMCLIGLVACGGKTYEDNIDYDIDLNNKPALSILMPYSGYTIQ